jgi:hypothetical protein
LNNKDKNIDLEGLKFEADTMCVKSKKGSHFSIPANSISEIIILRRSASLRPIPQFILGIIVTFLWVFLFALPLYHNVFDSINVPVNNPTGSRGAHWFAFTFPLIFIAAWLFYDLLHKKAHLKIISTNGSFLCLITKNNDLKINEAIEVGRSMGISVKENL